MNECERWRYLYKKGGKENFHDDNLALLIANYKY